MNLVDGLLQSIDEELKPTIPAIFCAAVNQLSQSRPVQFDIYLAGLLSHYKLVLAKYTKAKLSAHRAKYLEYNRSCFAEQVTELKIELKAIYVKISARCNLSYRELNTLTLTDLFGEIVV